MAKDHDFHAFAARFGLALKNSRRRVRRGKDGPEVAGYGVDRPADVPEGFIRLEIDEADYLFTLAARARHGVVEIGRFRGGSTLLLAWAKSRPVPLTSIDVAPQDDAGLRTVLRAHALDERLTLITGDSRREACGHPYDLLFVDGDHRYPGCLADLAAWAPGLRPGGHVAVHDCHRTGVQDAVEEFLDTHPDFYAVRGPYLPSGTFQDWGGGMAHLRKRPPEAPHE